MVPLTHTHRRTSEADISHYGCVTGSWVPLRLAICWHLCFCAGLTPSDSSVHTRTTAQLALGERGALPCTHEREPSAFAHSFRSTQIPKSGKLDAKVMQ